MKMIVDAESPSDESGGSGVVDVGTTRTKIRRLTREVQTKDLPLTPTSTH